MYIMCRYIYIYIYIYIKLDKIQNNKQKKDLKYQ